MVTISIVRCGLTTLNLAMEETMAVTRRNQPTSGNLSDETFAPVSQ